MNKIQKVKVDDCFESLEPAVHLALIKTEVYRRFMTERAALERRAAREIGAGRRLCSPQMLLQSKRVEALGRQALAEARRIRSLLGLPE